MTDIFGFMQYCKIDTKNVSITFIPSEENVSASKLQNAGHCVEA